MTAVLQRPTALAIPTPRMPSEPITRSTPAVAYQRVIHQTVRREFRLLAGLASWAPADDAVRTAEITRHADLVARVLIQHHATERELLWPALFRSLPDPEAARDVVADWTSRTALLDHPCATSRPWRGSGRWRRPSRRARRSSAPAPAWRTPSTRPPRVEERDLLPLLSRYLPDGEWTAITRRATTTLSGREQMLVLGLALEDACALDRARLLAGLSPAARTAWRVFGRRDFHAAVVRLRGAPPAA